MLDIKNELENFEKEVKEILNDAYKPISKAQSLENDIVLCKICAIHDNYQKRLIEDFRDSLLGIVPRDNEETA